MSEVPSPVESPSPKALAQADAQPSPAARYPATMARRTESRTAALLARWIRDLVVSLAIASFIIIFLYQPVKVEGTSMLPSLTDQERIFVNKFVYRLEPISSGDVVVFRYPYDTTKSYIKRVIAVGGDRVHIEDGIV